MYLSEWKLPPDPTQADETLNTDSPHSFRKTNRKKLAEEWLLRLKTPKRLIHRKLEHYMLFSDKKHIHIPGVTVV